MVDLPKLYGEKFDFPRWDGCVEEYAIAATPRTGSTYLSLKLWQLGCAGAPLEYLNPPFMRILDERFKSNRDLRALWNMVRKYRTSPNGIFGYKIFMQNYVDIGKYNPSFLRRICPPKIIYLFRQDKISQAVSYARAIQSKIWVKNPTKDIKSYTLDDSLVDKCLHMINLQYDFWRRTLEIGGGDILSVEYEKFNENPNDWLDKITRFLGTSIDARQFNPDIPVTEVQRDKYTNECINNYKYRTYRASQSSLKF